MTEVHDRERLSRFLLFSKWLSVVQRRVKPDAFIPHPRTELSVFCTEGLSEPEIWTAGEQVVSSRADNATLYGRADLKALDIRRNKLQVVRDDIPPRHANIIGWPADDRASQRMIAVELAASSSLALNEC